jgi:pimeloyl-ACP methyl ester carboxylesterase
MHTFRVPGAGGLLCFHDLAGDEPAIVFLHGLGGASSEEFPQTARHRLLADSRAVLIDFLGFGYSEAPADFGYTMEEQADSVAALLDDLGLSGVNVVGHSMGGSVAISLAARHPRSNLRTVGAGLCPRRAHSACSRLAGAPWRRARLRRAPSYARYGRTTCHAPQRPVFACRAHPHVP